MTDVVRMIVLSADGSTRYDEVREMTVSTSFGQINVDLGDVIVLQGGETLVLRHPGTGEMLYELRSEVLESR